MEIWGTTPAAIAWWVAIGILAVQMVGLLIWTTSLFVLRGVRKGIQARRNNKVFIKALQMAFVAEQSMPFENPKVKSNREKAVAANGTPKFQSRRKKR